MVKQVILIVSLLFIISCGSRKVTVSKITEEKKSDSVSTIKIDGAYVQDNNVYTVDTEEEIKYTPVDTSKFMDINGKKYKNTIISQKKKNKKSLDKTKKKSEFKIEKKDSIIKQDKKIVFDKHIEKPTNYWMYLWFLLPVIIIWVLEKYGKVMFPFLSFFNKK